MFRSALGPTQPPIRGSSLGLKRLGREADHSPPSSAEVKECVELYVHPQYVFMAWCLVKHRDTCSQCLLKIVFKINYYDFSPVTLAIQLQMIMFQWESGL
jgi:hypothetical protein